MKYKHVRLVAKRPCEACDGTGGPPIGEACSSCQGTGERETELLHPGEPFFLVRGHDQLGPQAIRLYTVLADAAGADTAGLAELGDTMDEFQARNPGLVKLAD